MRWGAIGMAGAALGGGAMLGWGGEEKTAEQIRTSLRTDLTRTRNRLDGFLLTGRVHPFRAVREEVVIRLRARLEDWGSTDGRGRSWRDMGTTSTAVRLALLAGRWWIGLLG